MTVLITADLHLNDLARDQYRHDWMANILPVLLKKYKISRLLILGDLCDSKDHHGAWLVNQLVDHFTMLAEICPIIIQMGNHDYIVADNPFFEFLGKIPGVTWISKPTTSAELEIPKISALFLPHTANYQRDWKGLKFDAYSYIFAHQTFQGAAVGPRKLDGIPTDIFPNDITVVSGDIHQPQEFGPIVYVGSPYLEDFGDDFNPRVLLLEDKNASGKLTSIPSPGPQKRLVEISSIAELSKQRSINSGDILKVRVKLAATDHAKWPTIKDDVKAWGEDNGFIIHLVQPQIDSKGAGGMSKRKTVTRTDEQLLETYAQSRAVSTSTLKTGLTLMSKI